MSEDQKLKVEKLESDLLKSQEELDKVRKELEVVQKHNQQLKNDLKENSETFEKSDQKNVMLEEMVEKVSLYYKILTLHWSFSL